MWPSKRPSLVTIPWTAEDDGKSRTETEINVIILVVVKIIVKFLIF